MSNTLEVYINKEDYPSMLDPIHIQHILGMSETKTYQFLKNPPFPIRRIGKLIKISKDIFIRWSEGEDFKQ